MKSVHIRSRLLEEIFFLIKQFSIYYVPFVNIMMKSDDVSYTVRFRDPKTLRKKEKIAQDNTKRCSFLLVLHLWL